MPVTDKIIFKLLYQLTSGQVTLDLSTDYYVMRIKPPASFRLCYSLSSCL